MGSLSHHWYSHHNDIGRGDSCSLSKDQGCDQILKVTVTIEAGLLVVSQQWNRKRRVVGGVALVRHSSTSQAAEVQLVVKEHVGIVVGCVGLGNHKSKADARLGSQVRCCGNIAVEVFYRVPVLNSVIECINLSRSLPVEDLLEVVYSRILYGVARADHTNDG